MNKYLISGFIFQSPISELLFIILKKYVAGLFPIHFSDLVLMNDNVVNDSIAEIIAEPIRTK